FLLTSVHLRAPNQASSAALVGWSRRAQQTRLVTSPGPSLARDGSWRLLRPRSVRAQLNFVGANLRSDAVAAPHDRTPGLDRDNPPTCRKCSASSLGGSPTRRPAYFPRGNSIDVECLWRLVYDWELTFPKMSK